MGRHEQSGVHRTGRSIRAATGGLFVTAIAAIDICQRGGRHNPCQRSAVFAIEQ
jgi:hypothetical protein